MSDHIDEQEPVWRVERPDQPFDWSNEPVTRVQTVEPRSWQPPDTEPPVRQPNRILSTILAAMVGAVFGTGATLVATHSANLKGGTTLVAPPVTGASSGGENDVAAVAAAVIPSIVRIDVQEQGPFGGVQGTGSGVIYRSDGYIVTNNHVVENATDVKVTMSDGSSLPARVVGTAAPAVDIAVVKVERSGMTPAVLGSTKDLKVGSLAVAIGSPFGLQGSVTAGVVSALHRNIALDQQTRFSDGIQTDAAINPGNSGGALADGNGRVIGINTAILSGSGGNEGVGFSIPIEIVRGVADQIIKTGHASLPFLGVSGSNLPNNGGALLQDVVSGGPAARAGLQAGDIIESLDGKKISSMDDLIADLLTKEVGQTVQVGFVRNGSHKTASARLTSRPGG